MDEQIRNLVSQLLTDPDPDKRRNAAEELAECHDRNILPVLSIALKDENKGVEDAVSQAFLRIGGAPSARVIVHHIADEDIATRSLAAKLLVKLGELSVYPLVPYLKDSDKDVRKLAVDILGEIRSREPIHFLLPLLRDPDPNVLVATLEAFGNIGSEEAIVPIYKTFERFPFTRLVAIEALGKIGGDSVRGYLEVVYKDMISDTSVDEIFIYGLLDALKEVGNEATFHLLLEHYVDIKENLRDMLLHVLVHIMERDNIEYQFAETMREDFLHALKNDDRNVRLSAAKGLNQYDDPIITRSLLLSLGDSEEMDCVVIAQMSSRTQVFQMALECLESGFVRGNIQIILLLGKLALGFIKSFIMYPSFPLEESQLERAFQLIVLAWQEANQEGRDIIADTLFLLDCDRTVSFLDTVLSEMDPWSRIHMIDQLLVLSTKSAIECIVRLADDENEMVKDSALSALRSVGYGNEIMPKSTGKELLNPGVA